MDFFQKNKKQVPLLVKEARAIKTNFAAQINLSPIEIDHQKQHKHIQLRKESSLDFSFVHSRIDKWSPSPI